jgi:hypothetical protein
MSRPDPITADAAWVRSALDCGARLTRQQLEKLRCSLGVLHFIALYHANDGIEPVYEMLRDALSEQIRMGRQRQAREASQAHVAARRARMARFAVIQGGAR